MPAARSTGKGRVRTTVRMPRSLYDEVRTVVAAGQSAAGNLNDFLVAAINAYVKLLKRRRIDAAFARMADDADFQNEAGLLAEEFGPSDWEAFELGEKDPVEARV